MSKRGVHSVDKSVDSIQQRLTSYACDLNYDNLPPEVIHAAKARVIDTLGGLIAGFFGEPCRIARNLAAQMPDAHGATIIGTRMKTTPDLAAFVNATTARYPAVSDSYHWPGSVHGHASDTVTPILGVAECAQISGREFITNVVLAYEIFLRICDVFHNDGFYSTNFASLAIAMAAAKVLGLSSRKISHSISMAVVPNNVLKQVVNGKSMFRAVASGQAGRAGVFAALLARSGMEGPHLPFEGKAGWCDHIARERFSLKNLGGNGTSFKILDTQIKNRVTDGDLIACVLAAEKVAPLNIKEVEHVTVEVYKYAKERTGTDKLAWNPDSRESADHSAPYNVAVTLMEGRVTLRSYNDAHLFDPELRTLMQKIEVVENAEFTKSFERLPVEHHARVIVTTRGGERLVAESGGDENDLSTPKSDAQIEEKFRGFTEEILSAKRVNVILDRLWHLEDTPNVAEIPSAFVLA